jgi:two-component system invasion response regulator UvrY
VVSTEILVVDDHQVVRQGVRSLIGSLRPEWTVSEAEDGIRATEAIRYRNPDVVIMDITMPGASGLETVSALRKAGFDRPVLMFTMHKSDQLGTETKQAGAQGYVLKSQAVEDLVKAIDVLLAGGTFFGTPPTPQNAAGDGPTPGLSFFIGLRPLFD